MRSCMPKTMNSKATFQAKQANPASSTQRESGKLGITKSSVVYNLSKNIWSSQIVLYVTKILQNFWIPFVFSSSIEEKKMDTDLYGIKQENTQANMMP